MNMRSELIGMPHELVIIFYYNELLNLEAQRAATAEPYPNTSSRSTAKLP